MRVSLLWNTVPKIFQESKRNCVNLVLVPRMPCKSWINVGSRVKNEKPRGSQADWGRRVDVAPGS